MPRARLLHLYLPPDNEYAWPFIEAAYPDWRRALALDATLDEARAFVIDYLRRTLKRDSAHEQIEALLNARQSLINAGLTAATSKTIIAEVERALAN